MLRASPTRANSRATSASSVALGRNVANRRERLRRGSDRRPTQPTLLVAARLESVPYAGPVTAATLVREVLLQARELTQR